MAKTAQKIVLQPGGSVVLQQVAGAVEVEASPCPDTDPDAGKGWEFPNGVVGLRVNDEIVGAMSPDNVAPEVQQSLQEAVADETEVFVVEVGMEHVLPLREIADAVVPPEAGESLRVLVPRDEIDFAAFRPLLKAAEARGDQVEFRVARTPS